MASPCAGGGIPYLRGCCRSPRINVCQRAKRQDGSRLRQNRFVFENGLSATMSNENKPGSRKICYFHLPRDSRLSVGKVWKTPSITFRSFCDLRCMFCALFLVINGCILQDGEAAQRLRVMPAHQQRLVMKFGSLRWQHLP